MNINQSLHSRLQSMKRVIHQHVDGWKIEWTLPSWFPVTIILLSTIGMAGMFLFQASSEVPMGDSYIHFIYARNLVDYHEFSYNPGLSEGIGTTSFLWVLLLAFNQLIGITPVISSTILGGVYTLPQVGLYTCWHWI
jgi:hypothetical protein